MANDLAPHPTRPFSIPIVSPLIRAIGYAGGIPIAAMGALRALVRPGKRSPRLRSAVARRLEEILKLGVPVIALAHVPLGSFLAMQAFFSATFTEAVGAVVGLGLLRNLATMMTGLTLAGFLAARYVPELRNRPGAGLDDTPEAVPDRDVRRGLAADPRGEDDPGRLVLSRVLAAAIAGPTLSLIGVAVGSGIGMLVAKGLLHVAPAIFIGKFLEMLRPVDVLGLAVKGVLFATVAALAACAEGLRDDGPDRLSIPAAVCRAACMAMFGILFLNGSWFTLAYRSGDPFGPLIGR
jgi:phospholipid/cholesterol/gamma-HCH transport system permease protein